jgi:hypothetical protein
MMKFSFAMLAMLVTGTGALWAAGTPCPAVGSDTNGCEFIITVTSVNSAGAAVAFTVAVNAPDQGAYDGSDDTLVGIINNSGSVLKSITLPNTAGQFSFDGDGACSGAYTPGPTAAQCLGGVFGAGVTGNNDYLSVNATSFSNITGSTGQVNFNNLANGATSWFDLEGVLTATQIGPSSTPAPNTLVLMLIGLAALTAFYLARGKFVRVS